MLEPPCSGCRYATKPTRPSHQSAPFLDEAGFWDQLEKEEAAIASGDEAQRLARPPLFEQYCAARSNMDSDEYLLCGSVAGRHCPVRVCSVINSQCERCLEGRGQCLKCLEDKSASPDEHGGALGFDVEAPHSVLDQPESATVDDQGESEVAFVNSGNPRTSHYELTLGAALSLVSQNTFGNLVAPGAYEEAITFNLRSVSGSVSFTDDNSLNGGFPQTVLVFGGPGSGKTHTLLKLFAQFLGVRPGGFVTGALILDPKGVMGPDIRRLIREAGRPISDLVEIGPVGDSQPVNVLDTGDMLSNRQLGHLLADIVISAFSDVADWDSFLYEVLETAVEILRKVDGFVTLSSLVENTTRLFPWKALDGKASLAPKFLLSAQAALRAGTRLSQDLRVDKDFLEAVRRIKLLVDTSESRQLRYLAQLIGSSLGATVEERFQSLSNWDASDAVSNIWSAPFRSGKILLVSIGEGDPLVRRTVCTLGKALFQIAAGTRVSDRVPQGAEKERLVALLCDEFGQVITERDADGLSDSDFFSRSRQYRCMNLLALQSVHMGLARVHNESKWKAIVGNANVRVFMSLNDSETAVLGSNMAGNVPILVPISSWTSSDDGRRASQGATLSQRSRVPETVLLQGLSRGCGVAIGRLDGRLPRVEFFQTGA